MSHPAPFSEPIVKRLDRLVRAEAKRVGFLEVLDPFAGVGRIHRMHRPGYVETTGIEIEAEWADVHELTIHGDLFDVVKRWRGRRKFDVIATSPTYGNRFSDHHTPKDASRRHGYAHDLGRMPTSGSSGVLPWGPRYWQFHADAYRALLSVTKPGGLGLFNVSDFVRHKEIVPAVQWHLGALYGAGWAMETNERPVLIATRRMRHGANHDARVGHEVILRVRRPAS